MNNYDNKITPKQKAKELVKMFKVFTSVQQERRSKLTEKQRAIQCALICVEEVLEHTVSYMEHLTSDDKTTSYWEKVKQELQAIS